MSCIKGMHSRSAVLSATYSASVVDRATSVCIFDAQEMGQLAYLMMYPVLLRAVLGSLASLLGPVAAKVCVNVAIE